MQVLPSCELVRQEERLATAIPSAQRFSVARPLASALHRFRAPSFRFECLTTLPVVPSLNCLNNLDAPRASITN